MTIQGVRLIDTIVSFLLLFRVGLAQTFLFITKFQEMLIIKQTKHIRIPLAFRHLRNRAIFESITISLSDIRHISIRYDFANIINFAQHINNR